MAFRILKIVVNPINHGLFLKRFQMPFQTVFIRVQHFARFAAFKKGQQCRQLPADQLYDRHGYNLISFYAE